MSDLLPHSAGGGPRGLHPHQTLPPPPKKKGGKEKKWGIRFLKKAKQKRKSKIFPLRGPDFKTPSLGSSYAPGTQIWCSYSVLVGKHLLLSKHFLEIYSDLNIRVKSARARGRERAEKPRYRSSSTA